MMNTMEKITTGANATVITPWELACFYFEKVFFVFFLIVFAPVTVPYMLMIKNHTKAAWIFIGALLMFGILYDIFTKR